VIDMAVPIDPAVLEGVARHISEHADDLRARASRLAAAADHVRWHSSGADGFRGDVRHLVDAFRRAATGVDDAADALRRHAAAVRRAEAVLRAAERVAAGAVHGAHDVGKTAVNAAEDTVKSLGHLVGW
jgi:uncharacterized protein YukE